LYLGWSATGHDGHAPNVASGTRAAGAPGGLALAGKATPARQALRVRDDDTPLGQPRAAEAAAFEAAIARYDGSLPRVASE